MKRRFKFFATVMAAIMMCAVAPSCDLIDELLEDDDPQEETGGDNNGENADDDYTGGIVDPSESSLADAFIGEWECVEDYGGEKFGPEYAVQEFMVFRKDGTGYNLYIKNPQNGFEGSSSQDDFTYRFSYSKSDGLYTVYTERTVQTPEGVQTVKATKCLRLEEGDMMYTWWPDDETQWISYRRVK